MLSRDADAVYWIGRYVERAESAARMIDVHYHFALENPLTDHTVQWSSLLAISGSTEDYHLRYGADDERSILEYFVFDRGHPNSIAGCIKQARENARSIRDQVSSEMWESINRTYLDLQEWTVDRILEETPHRFFNWVKNASHLFQGITNRTLMMGESRDFLDCGRFLERAEQAARILDVKYHDLLPRFTGEAATEDAEATGPLPDPSGVGGPVDVHGWIAVLKSVGAYEAYRKTHAHVTPTDVAGFLVLNRQFPASVRHCVARVEGCLKRISGNTGDTPTNTPERIVGLLNSRLTYSTPTEIISSGLHEYLEDVVARCSQLGAVLTTTYLTY